MKLCCFFNYPPLYRENIFRKIDQTFDTQFYFGKDVHNGQKSDIAKLDFSIFKKRPIEFINKIVLKKLPWRTKASTLAFKQYDTFLVTGDFSFSYLFLILFCKLLHKRVFAWGHGIKKKESNIRIFNDFFYNNLDGFFTYGEGGRRRLIELGFNPDKIHVIYNSLSDRASDNNDYSNSIYFNHFKNQKPVLIFIGRLTPQKKLELIIDAVNELKGTEQECNLVIIGTGICESQLKKQVKDHSLEDNIWFYGESYDENTNKSLLYNADLCVSPGNVGLTALHSLEYGTPVITHDNFETQMPEYETVVNYKTGLLFEEGNKNDLISKIKQWLNYSKGRRPEIRHNCYEMINSKWNSVNQIDILKSVLCND